MSSRSMASSEVSSLQPDKLTLAKAYYNRGIAYGSKGNFELLTILPKR